MDAEIIKSWFDDKMPINMPAIFLFVVAALFYFIWLNDIIPALINGNVPDLVKEYGLLTNPIHVLDISIALPGFLISAIILRKKHALGYVLMPAFIIFIIVMAIAIGGIIAFMNFKGFEVDISLSIIFALIAIISAVIFIVITKHLKK
jgi:hypothetical protein